MAPVGNRGQDPKTLAVDSRVVMARKPHKIKNAFVLNPSKETPLFGTVPRINYHIAAFSGGPIYLRQGEHISANHGFGIEHIWAEHAQQLANFGVEDKAGVADYIGEVIAPGAPLYFHETSRLTILAINEKHIAVIKELYDAVNGVFYSVITAYPKGNARGTLIGRVR